MIMYPLKPRITTNIGLVMAIVTWVLATVMSLPFAIYAKVERVELFLKSVDRCRICYPEPDYVYERSVFADLKVCSYDTIATAIFLITTGFNASVHSVQL